MHCMWCGYGSWIGTGARRYCCVNCGYDLTGSGKLKCSECGTINSTIRRAESTKAPDHLTPYLILPFPLVLAIVLGGWTLTTLQKKGGAVAVDRALWQMGIGVAVAFACGLVSRLFFGGTRTPLALELARAVAVTNLAMWALVVTPGRRVWGTLSVSQELLFLVMIPVGLLVVSASYAYTNAFLGRFMIAIAMLTCGVLHVYF